MLTKIYVAIWPLCHNEFTPEILMAWYCQATSCYPCRWIRTAYGCFLIAVILIFFIIYRCDMKSVACEISLYQFGAWFLPEASIGLRVLSLPASVCVCFRPCVNHELVRAITHDPYQLGSTNLDRKCKRPWLRSLLFLGVIDLDLQGQIELQSQNLPYFELVRAITHHPFKLGPPNLDQRCKISWLRSLLFWGVIEHDMSN